MLIECVLAAIPVVFLAGLPYKIDRRRDVIESEHIHTPVTICVLSDVHCRPFGRNQSRIKKIIDEENPDFIVIPGDLMHLARSGRLTASAARMATLLRITPILHLNRETAGKIDTYDKVISMRRAMKRVLEHMKEANLDENWHLTITHVNAIDLAETFYHQAQEMFPKAEMEILPLCSPVAVHVGIGSLCLQYFRKQ